MMLPCTIHKNVSNNVSPIDTAAGVTYFYFLSLVKWSELDKQTLCRKNRHERHNTARKDPCAKAVSAGK